MKSFLCTLSILAIMPCYFFAMDFNKEEGIPLEALSATYQKTSIKTTMPKSAEEQFDDFEGKIDFEYHQAIFTTKSAHTGNYFERAQKKAPAIVANAEVVKKFSLVKSSFYKKAIDKLIKQTESHYKNVTCQTLPTINNPNVSQPSSSFLDKLPFYVRAHVMECAYKTVCIQYPVVICDQNVHSCIMRSETHVAATANDFDGTFQICDLVTGISRILPKKSISGKIALNTNGSELATATIAQKEPKIIDIDIWDCQTGNNTHAIHHSESLTEFTLITQDDNSNKLIILDNIGKLLIYTIKTNTDPILSENLNIHLNLIRYDFMTDNLHAGYVFQGNKICKKCPAFYLCFQAIENTLNKDSLSNIRTAMLYLSLTSLEKKLIERRIKIRETTLTQQEEPQRTFVSWFG